jgi:hypothetical protein
MAELIKPVYMPPPPLVALVEQIMDGVRAGRISSLACITVSPMGQMQWPGFGMQIAELMIGADLMRDDMKQALRTQPSKILRAG